MMRVAHGMVLLYGGRPIDAGSSEVFRDLWGWVLATQRWVCLYAEAPSPSPGPSQACFLMEFRRLAVMKADPPLIPGGDGIFASLDFLDLERAMRLATGESSELLDSADAMLGDLGSFVNDAWNSLSLHVEEGDISGLEIQLSTLHRVLPHEGEVNARFEALLAHLNYRCIDYYHIWTNNPRFHSLTRPSSPSLASSKTCGSVPPAAMGSPPPS